MTFSRVTLIIRKESASATDVDDDDVRIAGVTDERNEREGPIGKPLLHLPVKESLLYDCQVPT